MEKIVSRDGTPIAYQRSGIGAPLVLVHGTSGTFQTWAQILPLLERKFTVYAIDRRGRGESGDSAGPYAMEREAQDVAAVVDAIGERSICLVIPTALSAPWRPPSSLPASIG